MAPKPQSEFFDELFTVSSRAPSKLDCLPACLHEDPLLELLLQNPQDFSSIKVADSVPLSDLIQRHILEKKIIYPNRETLGPEFTDEDYAKVCERIDRQHQQFQQRTIKDVEAKVQKFKLAFPHLTVEELFMALEEFEFHEDEVLLQLTQAEFIRELRKKIAKLSGSIKEARKKQSSASVVAPLLEPVRNVEEVPTSELISAIESHQLDSDLSRISEATEESEAEPESDESCNEEVSCESETENFAPEDENVKEAESIRVKRPATTKNYKKSQRLRLDEALTKADMQGWSEARIRAYQMLDRNPNTYYYRFNAPGETQRNGPWSTEEHEMFMKRLAECGADGQWGIFSMTIPGRVGYQCSNYYRKLIEAGQVSDSNYVMDGSGKAHYIGGKSKARRENEAEPEDLRTSVVESVKALEVTRTQTKRKAQAAKVLAKSVEIEKTEPAKVLKTESTKTVKLSQEFDFDNPLPGFIDAITRMEVSKPAISPYGHVLSYDTWIRCLLNSDVKNTCPITKQPLHKRQLTLLTHDNIEEFRSSIKDLCNKSK